MAQDFVYDYKKLNVRIFEKVGTKTNLARLMKTTTVTLSKKFNSKAEFTRKDIMTMCNILEIPIMEIPDYFFTLKEN